MLLSDKAYRLDAHKLVDAISSTLEKEKVELPIHGDLIKTGCGRQYSPYEKNWFYTRMASIVRQAMCKDKVSMTGLAHKYGVRKNRGVKPTKFTRGSRYVIGKAIDNLIQLGWFDFNQTDGIITEKAGKVLEKIMADLK